MACIADLFSNLDSHVANPDTMPTTGKPPHPLLERPSRHAMGCRRRYLPSLIPLQVWKKTPANKLIDDLFVSGAGSIRFRFGLDSDPLTQPLFGCEVL
jgi:hypothetical protein